MNPKALSLVSWTFQNVSMTLLMKASVQESHYSTCVAVLMDEAIKLVVCYAILSMYYYRGIGTSYAQVRDEEELGISSPVEEPMNQKRTLGGLLEFLEIEVFGSVSDFIYMCVPAICYAVQKNLSFVAITNLSPALYQVLFQGKNLTTAFFSYLMLGKHFSHRQKFSLILLGVGVALMEFSSLSEDSHTGSGSILKGTIAVACACVSSGFSGVYIERAIKSGDTTSVDKPYSLWVRNVQLSTFGVIASVLMVLHDDKQFVDTNGVFGGFTSVVSHENIITYV
jgi:UDP-galactose transporter